ncbi:MAG: class I SAM-dependent methyltransferase [Planctomycetales bacterium]|nr:class I SAM-dependent methyltransferase [Planctomycetales bacterium]
MSTGTLSTAATTFDAAASEYAAQLEQGISLSGEAASYFVEGRVAFLAQYLEGRMPLHGLQVLDFGCGVGNACGALRDQLHAQQVVGLDCSAESLEIARSRYPTNTFEWSLDGQTIAPQSMDVVYTSGVFHHIPPPQRQAELDKIYGWLKPGGYFALFENNPWNPATRWVMSRIPFDRDAQCLSPRETRRRLLTAGFQLELTRSLFYFPKSLRLLRVCEGLLSAIPLGAQYVVLCRRPA